MKKTFLQFVVLVGLTGMAVAQGMNRKPVNPVLDRWADAVTFYLDFEYEGLAVMSVGASRPFSKGYMRSWRWSEENVVRVPDGIRGQSLKEGALKYRAQGNLDLVRPGTLFFWVQPVNWVRSNRERSFDLLRIQAEKGSVLLGRQGLLVEEGVLKRGDVFYLQARDTKNALVGNLTNFAGTKEWNNERHLMALTWQIGRLGWSIDGRPFVSVGLRQELGPAAWFRFGLVSPLPVGQEVLLDELIILNKELNDDDIKWIYEQK